MLPSVAHGAAVSGTAGEHLSKLRQAATLLCRGRDHLGSGSSTLYLAMQKDRYLDPMYDVALAVVVKYCSFIWGGKLALGPLQRAWQCLA